MQNNRRFSTFWQIVKENLEKKTFKVRPENDWKKGICKHLES